MLWCKLLDKVLLSMILWCSDRGTQMLSCCPKKGKLDDKIHLVEDLGVIWTDMWLSKG